MSHQKVELTATEVDLICSYRRLTKAQKLCFRLAFKHRKAYLLAAILRSDRNAHQFAVIATSEGRE